MTFTIVTGNERYQVQDLQTGGLAWFADTNKGKYPMELWNHLHILQNVLGHTYQVIDRGEGTP